MRAVFPSADLKTKIYRAKTGKMVYYILLSVIHKNI